MNAFIRFMASPAGRILRIVAGSALMAWGLTMTGDINGKLLAAKNRQATNLNKRRKATTPPAKKANTNPAFSSEHLTYARTNQEFGDRIASLTRKQIQQ